MRLYTFTLCSILLFALNFYKVTTQLPPRLNIPGALLIPQSKPYRQRIHSSNSDIGPLPRLRRPIPNALPAPAPPPPLPPIRPVVEEPEDNPPQPQQQQQQIDNHNNFDDEASKLGISVLQSAVRQAVTNDNDDDDGDDDGRLPQRPIQFRPERPLPILRQDVRDTPPRPLPAVLRQEQQRSFDSVKPQIRVVPVRQPQQQFRQVARINPSPPTPRQPSQYIDQDDDRQTSRRKKPVVQILRKYRTDNPDGSITWGYENEDGTFKEETLGIDCITRGKYGYVDPDGIRRDYKYETGNKCDGRQQEDQEDDALLQNKQPAPAVGQSQNRKSQQQFRPLPSQY